MNISVSIRFNNLNNNIMSAIKISKVFVLIDNEDTIYPKLFLDEQEAINTVNCDALRKDNFTICGIRYY